MRDAAVQQCSLTKGVRLRLGALSAWRIGTARARWERALEEIRGKHIGQSQRDVATARRAVRLSVRWASRDARRAVVLVWRHAAVQSQRETAAFHRGDGLRQARAKVSILRRSLLACQTLSAWRRLVVTRRARDGLREASRRQNAFLLRVAWSAWRRPPPADIQGGLPVQPATFVGTSTTAAMAVTSKTRFRPSPPPPSAQHRAQRLDLSTIARPSSSVQATASPPKPIRFSAAASGGGSVAVSVSGVGSAVSGGNSCSAGSNALVGGRLAVPYVLVGRQPLPPQPSTQPAAATQFSQCIGSAPAAPFLRTSSSSPRLTPPAVVVGSAAPQPFYRDGVASLGASSRLAAHLSPPPRSALATPRSGSTEHRGGSMRVRIGQVQEIASVGGSSVLTQPGEEGPPPSSSTAVLGGGCMWSSAPQPGLRFGYHSALDGAFSGDCAGAMEPIAAEAARRASSADAGSFGEDFARCSGISSALSSARSSERIYSIGLLGAAASHSSGRPIGADVQQPNPHAASTSAAGGATASSSAFTVAAQELWSSSASAAEGAVDRSLGADVASAVRSWATDAGAQDASSLAVGGTTASSASGATDEWSTPCHPRRLSYSARDELCSSTVSALGSWLGDAQKGSRGGRRQDGTPNSARTASPGPAFGAASITSFSPRLKPQRFAVS